MQRKMFRKTDRKGEGDRGTAEDASLSHLQVSDGAVEKQKGSLKMC